MNKCELLERNLGAHFSCTEMRSYTRVRTPFLYPDGDVIDLYVREQAGEMTVTDLGETLRWLRAQSLSNQRSPKQNKLIEDICLNHGLELYRGMLQARVKTGEDFAGVVLRVAQGAFRVADLWFTMRTRSVESVADEVELFLRENNVAAERAPTLVGRSGRTWRPDFRTRTPQRSSLVSILSTGSRAAARNVAEHVLAEWYDLSHLRVGQESLYFVSLFDDTMDIWSEQDFNLLRDLSEVARWSQPEEFLRVVKA